MLSVTALHDLFEKCDSPEQLAEGFAKRYYDRIALVNGEVW